MSPSAVDPDVPQPELMRTKAFKRLVFVPADKYSSQFGGGSQYAYFHEEDETSFQLVDTAKTQKTAYQRNRMRFAQVTTPTEKPAEAGK